MPPAPPRHRWLSLGARLPLAARCRLCGSDCAGMLCDACAALAFAPRERCPRCAAVSPQARVCGRCLSEPPAFDRSIALADYDALTRPLIEAFKFHALPGLAHSFALPLAARAGAAPPLPGVLLPVPLSARRLRERGYNQAWELCKALGRELQRPVRADALLRTGERPAQAALKLAERRSNVKGAFVCPRRLDDVHVGVVDDVMTSGATLDEAAATLKRAGAAQVSAYLLCRTPLGD